MLSSVDTVGLQVTIFGAHSAKCTRRVAGPRADTPGPRVIPHHPPGHSCRRHRGGGMPGATIKSSRPKNVGLPWHVDIRTPACGRRRIVPRAGKGSGDARCGASDGDREAGGVKVPGASISRRLSPRYLKQAPTCFAEPSSPTWTSRARPRWRPCSRLPRRRCQSPPPKLNTIRQLPAPSQTRPHRAELLHLSG